MRIWKKCFENAYIKYINKSTYTNTPVYLKSLVRADSGLWQWSYYTPTTNDILKCKDLYSFSFYWWLQIISLSWIRRIFNWKRTWRVFPYRMVHSNQKQVLIVTKIQLSQNSSRKFRTGPLPCFSSERKLAAIYSS